MTIQGSIRLGRPGDEAAFSLVGPATFLETFAEILQGRDIVAHCAEAHAAERYREWLSDSRYALWIVECERSNAPIGYMVIGPSQLPVQDIGNDIELKKIYLLSKFHGIGIGRQLISLAISYSISICSKRLLLGVYAHNDRAIAFYRDNGFEQIATRKYRVGDADYDDIVMGLFLES
ncbi:MAG: GNAT family N-acetyltransferase [Alphaproteobacteria bacterium]|nr:MAG: GNAT family N-acetyltransferase [Alphaproteobacteria bacterium]